jgi:hypothetical protein
VRRLSTFAPVVTAGISTILARQQPPVLRPIPRMGGPVTPRTSTPPPPPMRGQEAMTVVELGLIGGSHPRRLSTASILPTPFIPIPDAPSQMSTEPPQRPIIEAQPPQPEQPHGTGTGTGSDTTARPRSVHYHHAVDEPQFERRMLIIILGVATAMFFFITLCVFCLLLRKRFQ